MKLAEAIQRIGEKMAIGMIFNDANKTKIVKSLNKQINIPFASEKDEEVLIKSIYEEFEKAAKEALK